MALRQHLHLMLARDPREALEWLAEKRIISREAVPRENVIRLSLKGLR